MDEFDQILSQINTNNYDEYLQIDEIDIVNLDNVIQSNSSRFVSLSNDEREKILSNAIPKSTKQKENWAIKIFQSWHKKRQEDILNGTRKGLMVLKDMSDWTGSDWNVLLKEFLLEVRKENGEKYVSSSLKDLFSMLQHHVQYSLEKNISFWNDAELRESRRVLDAAMKDSTTSGFVSGINLNIIYNNKTYQKFEYD